MKKKRDDKDNGLSHTALLINSIKKQKIFKIY